ncbi:hypothetical protein J3Q64DRAFT_1666876 [Phycomyces blakesleeanus]|uniref:DUF4112 domain-containing protein n=2 Tax=Phycomyces blakesleeanus TaxID=4837 RepID=A0A163B9D0_PHYB8|nr:hypothetical protein PHYBLDRAFT_76964 [Phycomyces blakesleeanus NRRL 1555(-)]OAD78961.1 hypothetical protein PHYBLDRAFT_76964 [Phycomyces blakesleeanus NRRL 1555(-)]|eukprot:XP_018297001.1 hypothetical protein PHYBLDRAFT_76964 [Phycomyces blakesleeanus NRRL 1555(-)]
MTTIAKRLVLGKAAERFNKPSVVATDAEIKAAIEEAAHSKRRHWWQSKATPDIILNERDRNVLRSVKRKAVYLDKGFDCCCCQIGLDPIVGLIPVVGDMISMIMALQIIRIASRADLPRSLLLQMLGNVMMDFLVGLTPVAGDILDVLFKCNWRNAQLLEEYLMVRRRDEIRAEKGLLVHADNDSARSYAQVAAAAPPPPKQSSSTSTSTSAPANQSHGIQTHLKHTQPHTQSTTADSVAIAIPPEQPQKKQYGTFFTWLRSSDTSS